MKIRTLGEAREFLKGYPDDTEAVSVEMDDAKFVVLVDSQGNARRVTVRTTKTMAIFISIPFVS
jgi:hypothetical protein